MSLKRYTIRPLSPWGTRLRSDTLAGLLLCRIAEQKGDVACKQAIEAFKAGEPPFVVSSVLPKDKVPMPKLPAIPRARFQELVNSEKIRDLNDNILNLFEALNAQKKFRKQSYLPLKEWISFAKELSTEALFTSFCKKCELKDKEGPQPKKPKEQPWEKQLVEPHVTIDRRAQTAQQGGLFFNHLTTFQPNFYFQVYARTEQPYELLELLKAIGDQGFGKDASTGKGRFSAELDEAFDAKSVEIEGESSLLCSVLGAEDMSGLRGWYAVGAKRGKAGPMHANPFKNPMVLVEEGAILESLPKGPYVLTDIHPDSRLVQITVPLTLNCHLTEENRHGRV
ncbi:MAG: hypothetical protein IJS50_01480 [Desulfovibrio sp.]|nr:hypothetical protein [Desulfovibrio sp.]